MYPTTLQGMHSKMNDMLTRKAITAQENINKIWHDAHHLTDALVPMGNNEHLKFINNGTLKVAYGGNEYKLHNHALRQLASRYNIPTKYAADLAQTHWGRELLRETFDSHKINSGDTRFLFRSVEDQVRGVLSDSYRRLNSLDVYTKFMHAATGNGAVVYDALYTDTKTFINVLIPHVFEVETPENGTVYSMFGAEITNSDFGASYLKVRVTQMNLVCDNGLISQHLVKEMHRGSRFPDGINFSVDTYNYDTKATASAINDVVKQSLSRETLEKTVNIMKEASAKRIEIDKEFEKLKKSTKLNMSDFEMSQVDRILKNNNPEDGVQGNATKWKMAQAVTAICNLEEINAERKKEISEWAGAYVGYKI
jgi:hypothetical protein